MVLLRTASATLIGLAVILFAAAAHAADPPQPSSGGDKTVGGALTQPVRDLNLLRDDVPEILIAARAAPYATGADCIAGEAEIAQLDQALGADIDQASEGGGDTGETILAGAVRSALSLPFRGVVRRLTGAEKHDREFRAAVLAGMVRRGYLKGALSQMDCTAAPVRAIPPQAPEVVETSEPILEEVHDGREVPQADGLVEQGRGAEPVVGEAPVAGREGEGDPPLSESRR